MNERILVPLDGSARAERALPYADLLPSRSVRLLHVEPATEDPIIASPEEWDSWRAARETAGSDYLDGIAARLRRPGRTVETAFAFGDPANWILANSGDADLVVMTTHGRGAGSRALFGSVADRVARHAQTPTLLLRDDGSAAALPRIVRVVVPLDGSPLAENALPVAARIAADLGAPIHLIRVLDINPVRAAVEAGIPAARAHARAMGDVRSSAEAALAAQAETLRSQQLPTSYELLEGAPAATLLDSLSPSDLVVMTSHGRGGVGRWLLGSVADKLVREAPAPVLLVRAPAGDASG